MILTGSSSSLISALTHHLRGRFAVKDLGALTFFLGVEVARCREGLLLLQHKYTVELLRRHGMDGAKTIIIPMATSSPLTVSGSFNASEFRSALGGLQYLTLTRPDIAFAVNKLAQAMASPTLTDWLGVKRVFRYLKGTLHHGLLDRKSTRLNSSHAQ